MSEDDLSKKIGELVNTCHRLETKLEVLTERVENLKGARPALIAGGLSGSGLAGLLIALERMLGR